MAMHAVEPAIRRLYFTASAAADPFPAAGKTTFLRALSTGEIPGLPPSCQVLHVEQEVVGDDTPVLQVRWWWGGGSVLGGLRCDNFIAWNEGLYGMECGGERM
jgi:hypothetical protein